MRIGAHSCVTSAFRNAIYGEVFQGRSYAVLLDAVYHLYAEFADQIRVFSIRLEYTSPARIAGNIEDGSIYVVIS